MNRRPRSEDGLRREWVEITGRVQGVGFRAMVAEIALGRPVAGWVRNEPRGSVLMLLEAAEGDLDAFIEAIVQERATDIAGLDRRPVETGDAEKGPSGPLTGFSVKFNRLPGR